MADVTEGMMPIKVLNADLNIDFTPEENKVQSSELELELLEAVIRGKHKRLDAI